jgi:hypothetical protein
LKVKKGGFILEHKPEDFEGFIGQIHAPSVGGHGFEPSETEQGKQDDFSLLKATGPTSMTISRMRWSRS